MGGRGAGAGITGGHGLQGRIDNLNKKADTLGRKMYQLTRLFTTDGKDSKVRAKYYKVKNRRDSVIFQRNRLIHRQAAQPAKPVEHTFVNGYGEATKREITSNSYSRGQNRITRQVMRNMGY